MEFKKLPITIRKTLMQGVAYTEYNNKKILYGVIAEGECATFIIVNIKSKKIENQFELENATGSWAISVTSDNRVYIGTYVNGGLYRYDPKKEVLETLFETITGAKFIFDLKSDNENNVYGGTWPNCALFKYNGNEERLDFLKENIVENENYVRNIAVDKEKKVIYASIQSHAHIIEVNEKTGEKKNILPEEYSNEVNCRIIGYKENKLAVYASKAKQLFILDTTTKEITKKVDIENIENTIPTNSNSENFKFGRIEIGLAIINFEKDEFYLIKSETNEILINAWAMDEGSKILYTSFEGIIYSYSIVNAKTEKLDIVIPKKEIEIRQIHEYKNKLYGGGYLKGGTFIYDIEKNVSIQFDGVGQSEGLITNRDKLYIGKYPGAYIYEYDLIKEWDIEYNPKELFNLKNKFNQDRPFAMEVYSDVLFIGTIPNYGSTKGALTICKLDSKKFTVLENFIDNQSIVSLKAKNGILYGGTTVCGGLGSHSKTESGTLFAYDIEKNKKIFEITPVKGRKNVGGLYITDDDLILACADTTFFIYDIKENKKIFEQYVCLHNPDKDYKWEISFIKKGPNSLFYIVTGNRLFSFNMETKEIKSLYKKKVNLLEIDNKGHLYCQEEEDVRHIIRSINAVE